MAKIQKLKFSSRQTSEEVKKEFSQEEYDKDYELKIAVLEFVMGKSADLAGHAIIVSQ